MSAYSQVRSLNTLYHCTIKRWSLFHNQTWQGRWNAPHAEYLKPNVNEAIFVAHNKAGIRLILQDEHRAYRLEASMAEHGVGEPEDIELLAILRGLTNLFRYVHKKDHNGKWLSSHGERMSSEAVSCGVTLPYCSRWKEWALEGKKERERYEKMSRCDVHILGIKIDGT